MVLPQKNPGREPGGGRPPYKPPAGNSPISGTPGLLTSTGGISGAVYEVLQPLFDITFNKTYLAFINGDNADCEEDGFYYYPQEDIMPNRKISVHLIMLTYREIGKAKFKVGVETYIRETDSFTSIEKDVVIAPTPKDTQLTFPDGKLHTAKLDFVISGERPQAYIKRTGGSGSFAVTRLLMVGKADEMDLM